MTIESRKVTSRDEWLKWRRQDLTASDVAAAAGLDDRRSALSVFAEKTGMVAPGDFDSNILRRGRWLEPAIIAAIREERPDWTVRRADVYLRDPEHRLGATPDAVAEIPGMAGVVNLQLKTVARSVYDRDWPADEAPLGYQVQTLTEGLLMGASHNMVVAFVIGEFSADLFFRDVPRHAAAERRAVEVADEFWARVARQEPPPGDFSKDAELVSRLYPASVPGQTIDLSTDNRMPTLLEERERLKAIGKGTAAELEAVETEIKAKLGIAERAIVPGWRTVSFKTSPRKGYEVQPGFVRTLRITRDKEGD